MQSNEDAAFEVGQVVEATGDYGHLLTKGKQYIVTEYQPKQYDPTFTWPAYVTVIGDAGKPVTGHAHRFRAMTDPNPVS